MMPDIKNNIYGRDKYLGASYNHPARFASYAAGYGIIKSLLNNGNILEIGSGNKILANLLTSEGFNVFTADIDRSLNPDYLCDVRKLSDIIEYDSFDLIYAFQVLEHIPIDELSYTVKGLSKLTKKYLIISLPKVYPYFQLAFHVPFMQRFFKKEYVSIQVPVKVNKRNTLDPGHYWEIGSAGVNESTVLERISTYFKSVKEFSPQFNQIHKFYILEK